MLEEELLRNRLKLILPKADFPAFKYYSENDQEPNYIYLTSPTKIVI